MKVLKRVKASCPYLLALSMLVLPILLFGCGTEAKVQPKQVDPKTVNIIRISPLQKQNIGLQLGTVHQVEFVDEIECNGQIQASNFLTAQVFSPASGRIMNIPVTAGQFVRQGQILATVKSDEAGQLQAELLQQTLQNEADYHQGKVQLALSKAAYERELQLFKEEIGAKADLETTIAQYRKDQENLKSIQTKNTANIQAVRERLSLYGVGNETANRVIRTRKIYPFLSITAPRSGLLVTRNVNNGEMVDTSKELFSITDLSHVWLTGSVYEKDVPKAQLGQPVNVKLDSQPDRRFTGTVNFISSVLNPQTRTLDVRAEIPNPGLSLKPNMFARMSVQVGKKMALAVPLCAIEKMGDFNFAFVQTGPNVLEARKVTIGHQNSQFVEILNGLAENETIAVQGTLGLKGMVIKAASDTGG